MSKLTKAEAARQMGISRTTLYKFIHEGTVSVHPDGSIDTAELVRAVSTLTGSTHQRGRSQFVQHGHLEDTAMDVDTSMNEQSSVHNGQMGERSLLSHSSASARQLTSSSEQRPSSAEALAVLRKERDMLQAERDRLAQQVELLLTLHQTTQQHLTQTQQMLHGMQQRYDRLLEAPRPVVGPQSVPRAQRPAAPWPLTWQRIAAYLEAHPGSARPKEVGAALVLPTCPYIMRRMCDAGLLVRVAPGVYQLAEQQD